MKKPDNNKVSNRINELVIIVMSVFTLMNLQMSHASENNAMLSLSLTAKQMRSSVLISAEIKNISKKQQVVIYNKDDLLFSCEIFLTGPDGVKLQPFSTASSEIYRNTSTISQFLKPGKSIVSQFEMNRFYDLSVPGEYRMQLKYKYNDPQNAAMQKTIISSDAITFSIAPDLPAIPKIISKFQRKTVNHEKVELFVASDNDRYQFGEPVFVSLWVKNNSGHHILRKSDTSNVFDSYKMILIPPGPEKDFRKTKLHSAANQASEFSLYGKHLLDTTSMLKDVKLQIGAETNKTIFQLNRVFHMTEDGIYGLIVTYNYKDSAGKERSITTEAYPVRLGITLTQEEIDEYDAKRKDLIKTN